MKKFIVEQISMHRTVHVVEAETEEQALDLVLDGDVEAIHTWTEESSNDDLSEFEVFDNKENN